MKILPADRVGVILYILLFLFLEPAVILAQSGKTGIDIIPVTQQLVREGAFAVRLISSLSSMKTKDETAAESILGDMGIAPHNGWIADYPITPDIVGELQNAVTKAAESGRLKISSDEAYRRFKDVCAEYRLSVEPEILSEKREFASPESWKHPDPASISEQFSMAGPPVITYYDPPPAYSHLYCMVPYPFRSHGLRFPGFFILNQFHRTLFEDGRVEFVSNSFHVFRNHRVFRIDPVARYRGDSFAGIGASNGKKYIKTGIRGSENKVFNGPQPLVKP